MFSLGMSDWIFACEFMACFSGFVVLVLECSGIVILTSPFMASHQSHINSAD